MTQTGTETAAVQVPAIPTLEWYAAELQLMCVGGAVLGSGGGGSYQLARSILQSININTGIPLVSLQRATTGAWATMVADMGAPSSLNLSNEVLQSPVNALAAMEAYCAAMSLQFPGFDGFSYLYPVETGAVNSLIPFVAALSGNRTRAVVDADGAGRAVPVLQLTTYAGKLPLFPNFIGSAGTGSNVSIGQVNTQTEVQAENALAAMIASPTFGGVSGLAMYAVTTDAYRACTPVPGVLSTAVNVGNCFNSATGPARAQAIADYLTSRGRQARPVFEGRVTGMVQVAGEHDVGTVTITADDGTQLWIFNENENIFCSRTDTGPLVIGPDSICYVPHEGDPYDNSDLYNLFQSSSGVPGRVTVLAVDAPPEVKANAILMSTWQGVLAPYGYAGPYVQPWLND